MENEDTNIGNQPNSGALSIYGQADAAMDDFPVLKAFQQYIDAEQSKSRKRMIMLCMFFAALMTIVVAVFVLMIAQMSRDKQHVNDQLIQFLIKERERAPVAVQPQPQPVVQPVSNPVQDATLKAMTETLATIQQQMADQRKADEEAAAAAPTKAELERERRAEQETERLRLAKEKLEAEKRALADEKERLRQAEVERQRRRLYPEYYQEKEQGAQTPSQPQVRTTSPKPAPKKRELTDEDIDDILREVDELKAADETKQKSKKTQKPKRSPTKIREKKTHRQDSDDKPSDGETTADKPTEYMTDTEYALPVQVNGEDSGWSIPLPNDEK